MTIAPYWLDEPHTQSVLVENPRTFDKCAVEALGTFGLLLTVGVGMYSRTPLAALGIGVVLMSLIYAGGLEIGGFGRPMMCVEVHILGAKFVITMGSNSRRDRGVDVGYDRAMDQRAVGGQARRRRTGLRRFRWALASG